LARKTYLQYVKELASASAVVHYECPTLAEVILAVKYQIRFYPAHGSIAEIVQVLLCLVLSCLCKSQVIAEPPAIITVARTVGVSYEPLSTPASEFPRTWASGWYWPDSVVHSAGDFSVMRMNL
jgi:hypothetical protein